MTRNEMRELAKQIISDAAAVVTAAYTGQEHRPDMTTAALLAHYVLLEFPPEDSEPAGHESEPITAEEAKELEALRHLPFSSLDEMAANNPPPQSWYDEEPMFMLDEVAALLEDNGDDNNVTRWYRVFVNGMPVNCHVDAIKAALRKLKGME